MHIVLPLLSLLYGIFHVNGWTPHPTGFFGMIGPRGVDVFQHPSPSLYELFSGDGIIQGVFIEPSTEANGQPVVHPVHHRIQTQRTRSPFASWKLNTLNTLFFAGIQWITGNRINLLGAANTHILTNTPTPPSTNTHTLYALYERDLPYEIQIHWTKRSIETAGRIPVPESPINYLSGHTKPVGKTFLVSVEYHVLRRQIRFHILRRPFLPIQTITLPTTYLPIVHDFAFTPDTDELVWVESPFRFLLQKKKLLGMPVGLDEQKPTLIHVGSQVYSIPASFALFHFAHIEETPEKIRLYAPIYDRLHFADDVRTLSGKYRCLCIHKLSQQVVWEVNPELEHYNLDFPVKFTSGGDGGYATEEGSDSYAAEDDGGGYAAEETLIVLRNIDDQTHRMNGFVVCHGLQIVQKLFWENRTVLGEPVVVRSRENKPLLLFFAVSNHTTCLVQYDLDKNSLEEIPLNMPFTMGFHSFFLKYSSTV